MGRNKAKVIAKVPIASRSQRTIGATSSVKIQEVMRATWEPWLRTKSLGCAPSKPDSAIRASTLPSTSNLYTRQRWKHLHHVDAKLSTGYLRVMDADSDAANE